MALPFVYPADPPSLAQSAPGNAPAASGTTASDLLGRGLVTPFRRDGKGDFANASGEDKVRACVAQVLGTEGSNGGNIRGELPWRDEFGSLLFRLRYLNNDATATARATLYVRDALERWEPRVRLKAVVFSRVKTNTEAGGADALVVSLTYDIVRARTPGNQVLTADVRQDVRLS